MHTATKIRVGARRFAMLNDIDVMQLFLFQFFCTRCLPATSRNKVDFQFSKLFLYFFFFLFFAAVDLSESDTRKFVVLLGGEMCFL